MAYDSRATSVPECEVLETSLPIQPSLKIYRKTFEESESECVNLGTNRASGFTGDSVSNYIVFYNADATSTNTVIDDGGTLKDTVYVNQQEDGGQWNFLGVYEFSTQVRVVIVSEGNDLTTCADAVRFTASTSLSSD